MSKPHYPTTEGLWSKGQRAEEGYREVRLGVPYPEAVEQFRKAIDGRSDFDPAVLFAWGTMQATAVLNVLKAIEEAYGEAGQAIVRKAINKAGYEAMDGFLTTSRFPDGIDEIELISYMVTGINTVLYASLERPRVTSEDRCEFDILWCPHQDRYSAFDCRVQRFFVEGILQAVADRGRGKVTAWVDKLIPRGSDRCHFVVEKLQSSDGEHPWRAYSDELNERALKKLEEVG
jgi:hypothetical protein